MDFKSFLGNATKTKTTTTDEDDQPENEKKKLDSTPSNSELFSSAKLVAEAARSTFNNESDKVDKAKVAEAGADLLDAAETYGKLEEKGFGSYLDKAEQYLHNYNSSSQSPAKTADSGDAPPPAPAPEKHSSEEESGGGGGGYMKMAEGLFKSDSGEGKKSSGDEEKSEGGGGYMKMAQGLFK